MTQEKHSNNLNPYPELSLRDLIDSGKWKKIQNNFSTVTDIGLRIVGPEGALIIPSTKQPRLCGELLENALAREKICGDGFCLPTFLHGKSVVDKNLSFSCAAGLHHFIAPLIIDKDKILGYLIIGPVILVMRKPKEEYAEIAHELRIEQDELWNAILEIKTISFHCVQSLLELIKDVAEYTLKLSYQQIIKEREIAPAEDSATPHAQWLGSAKLNRLLDALLDVAFETSRADIGSVMFYDKTNNELTIKASRGIAENIVKNAKVKIGEGISGIAIEEGRAFLIDTATRDSRITPYLARPQIRSSMVIPLKIEDKVVGVMNVGALNTSQVQFNEDSMALMIKLADLATVAIHPSKAISPS